MRTSKPRVFLCHASSDKPTVRKIYRMLKEEGYSPWLDEEDLRGGQNWRETIEQVISQSDYFLACLSEAAVDHRGFFQKELRLALEVLDTLPEDAVYLIPVRLEPCRVPNRLSSNHWIDFYADGFRERLLRSLTSEGAPVAQFRTLSHEPEEGYSNARDRLARMQRRDVLEVRVEIDYSRLVEFLHTKQWAAAAYETLSLCVLASGRRSRTLNLGWDYGTFEGMETGDHIPSIHLRKLTDLWRESGRTCKLPIARKAECESAFYPQIDLVNRRCKECGLPPLMESARHEDLEMSNNL